jgi:hypothetical protein
MNIEITLPVADARIVLAFIDKLESDRVGARVKLTRSTMSFVIEAYTSPSALSADRDF